MQVQIKSDFLDTAKRKIFVIEDDNGLAEFMQLFFDISGYRYRIIGKTENILPLIDEFKPDLVILDYMLPEINGGEICAQIKNNIGTHYVPVLIFSAYPGVLYSLGDCGYDAFLAKPFELNDLEKIIETLAGRMHLI
ncbi:response regulator [Pedobacter steynii]|uniref:Response regulatory domain-containing protein n=1 Tax=Pedobacter steynii TaxID=430522 RepID=A0A1D7QLV6_9SPHI|nr:response regulator [Pedobacter steynii]AOM79640.1 hypothetical protein BFS30_22265 [Pedobacter steynii]